MTRLGGGLVVASSLRRRIPSNRQPLPSTLSSEGLDTPTLSAENRIAIAAELLPLRAPCAGLAGLHEPSPVSKPFSSIVNTAN